MTRKVHFAVDDLSEDAQRVIRDVCDRRSVFGRLTATAFEIVSQVEKRTGEKIAASSLNRYVSWYCAEMRDRALVLEKVKATAKTLAENGAALSDAAQANLLEAFYEVTAAGVDLKEVSPILLGKLALSFREEDRKGRELEEKKRANDIKERELQQKVDALEAKDKALAEKVKKAVAPENTELTEEEKKKVRSIYGLD